MTRKTNVYLAIAPLLVTVFGAGSWLLSDFLGSKPRPAIPNIDDEEIAFSIVQPRATFAITTTGDFAETEETQASSNSSGGSSSTPVAPNTTPVPKTASSTDEPTAAPHLPYLQKSLDSPLINLRSLQKLSPFLSTDKFRL